MKKYLRINKMKKIGLKSKLKEKIINNTYKEDNQCLKTNFFNNMDSILFRPKNNEEYYMEERKNASFIF